MADSVENQLLGIMKFQSNSVQLEFFLDTKLYAC